MFCKEFINKISLYFDNEISLSEKKQVEDHLRNCNHCKKIYDDYCVMNLAGAQILQDPPEGMLQNIMRDISIMEFNKKKKVLLSRLKFPTLWRNVFKLGIATLIIFFGLAVFNSNEKKVMAKEIVFKMAHTLENLDSYYAEIIIEDTQEKPNGKRELLKGKIVEYMKKPYYQRIESDLPVKQVEISNGEKVYRKIGSLIYSNTNPMNIPQSRIFSELSKSEILIGLNNNRFKLIGETKFNDRQAYEIEGTIIEYNHEDFRKNFDARLVMLLDKETSIPIKTSYYKNNETKPYRQIIYKVLKLNPHIEENIFNVPKTKKEYTLWKPVKDIKTAQQLIKAKIDIPNFLPEGAKLNKIGFANRSNIRLEYTVGKNVIYITYGSFIEDSGKESFWSSQYGVYKGNDKVSVAGTLPIKVLRKVAESIVTLEEKKEQIYKEKARKDLLDKYKESVGDVNVSQEKYSGKIESLKIVTVDEYGSIWGPTKQKHTIYFRAPFDIHTETTESKSSLPLIYIQVGYKHYFISNNFRENTKLTYQPITYLLEPYEEENHSFGNIFYKGVIRKIIGKGKYLNRPVTIIEYTFNSEYKGYDSNIQKHTKYIDDETGIVLKRWDTNKKGENINNYYVTELLVNPEISNRLFEIPDNIKPINEYGYQEVSLEQLKTKSNVPVKIPKYLPKGTKLIHANIFNYGSPVVDGIPRNNEAVQFYTVDNQSLIIYSRKKYPGEPAHNMPEILNVDGVKYYYGYRNGIHLFESKGNKYATQIRSNLPLEELKKIIASMN